MEQIWRRLSFCLIEIILFTNMYNLTCFGIRTDSNSDTFAETWFELKQCPYYDQHSDMFATTTIHSSKAGSRSDTCAYVDAIGWNSKTKVIHKIELKRDQLIGWRVTPKRTLFASPVHHMLPMEISLLEHIRNRNFYGYSDVRYTWRLYYTSTKKETMEFYGTNAVSVRFFQTLNQFKTRNDYISDKVYINLFIREIVKMNGSWAVVFLNELYQTRPEWLGLLQHNNGTFLQEESLIILTIYRKAIEARNAHLVHWLEKQSWAYLSESQKSSLLFAATSHRATKVLKKLLEGGADPVSTDPKGRTPLHLAIALNVQPAISILLKYNVGHDILDHTKRSPLSYAVAKKDLLLVQRLVAHKTFFSKSIHTSTESAVDQTSRIIDLLGHVPPQLTLKLLRIECFRANMQLCGRTHKLKQGFLWQFIRKLMYLPSEHRKPYLLQFHASAIHMLLNFFLYARTKRIPGYTQCVLTTQSYKDTSRHGSTEHSALIALEFLLEPSHPLHNNEDLLKRLYLAIRPERDTTLLAELIRVHHGTLSSVSLIRKKPKYLPIDVFQLGRVGLIDPVTVSVRFREWNALPLLISALYKCLASPTSIEEQKHYEREYRTNVLTIRRQRCFTSLAEASLHASEDADTRVFSMLFSQNPNFVVNLLADSLIINNRIAQRNLYLLNATLTYPSQFPLGILSGRYPLETAVLSYLTTRSAEHLTDMKYLSALLSSPWYWFSHKDDIIQRVLQLIGTALVYGFVSDGNPLLKSPLLDAKGHIWDYIFLLFCNPPIRLGFFTHTASDIVQSPEPLVKRRVKNITQIPQKVLGMFRGLSANDISYVLGRNQLISRTPSILRPSDSVLKILADRRRQIFRMFVTSPIMQQIPQLKIIRLKILKCFSTLIFLRFGYYLLQGILIPNSLDPKEMTLPASSTFIAAFLFGIKYAFLGHVGSRHHAWDTITTLVKLIDTIFSILALTALYIFCFWTNKYDWILEICVLQVTACAAAGLSSYWITQEGHVFLISNFTSCSLPNLSTAVHIAEDDLTEWQYFPRLKDELAFNNMITYYVQELKHQYRYDNKDIRFLLCQDRYFDIWNDLSDINVAYIFHGCYILSKLLNASSNYRHTAVSKKSSHYYYNISSERPYKQAWAHANRLFRLEHKFFPRDDPAVAILRFLGHTLRQPYDVEYWSNDETSDHEIEDKCFIKSRHDYVQKRKDQHSDALEKKFSSLADRHKDIACIRRDHSSIPYVEVWERCSVTPPAFLYNFDKNIYLGQVQDPNLEEYKRICEELGEPAFDSEVEEFLGPADILRIQRRADHLLDIGATDLGGIQQKDWMKAATILTTIDFLPLFHCVPSLRRFITHAFFKGLTSSSDCAIVAYMMEIIAFSCTFVLYIEKGDSFRGTSPLLHSIYSNPYLYLMFKNCPNIIIILGVFQAYAYNRLLIQILRLLAAHILLCLQAGRVGSLFDWKQLQPYLVDARHDLVKIMHEIGHVRRVVCRRLDNMIEGTQHQINIFFFGTLILYLPFIFLLTAFKDQLEYFELLFSLYMVVVAATVGLIIACLFGSYGYEAMCKFVYVGNWIHRLVDPTRSKNHPLICTIDKNSMEPTLHSRSFAIAGFRFTTAATTILCMCLFILSFVLGIFVLGDVYPKTLGRWSASSYLSERYGS